MPSTKPYFVRNATAYSIYTILTFNLFLVV